MISLNLRPLIIFSKVQLLKTISQNLERKANHKPIKQFLLHKVNILEVFSIQDTCPNLSRTKAMLHNLKHPQSFK